MVNWEEKLCPCSLGNYAVFFKSCMGGVCMLWDKENQDCGLNHWKYGDKK
jgi:hypothetical protein